MYCNLPSFLYQFSLFPFFILNFLFLLLFLFRLHKRPSKKTHNGRTCFGDCDETVCNACYYSNETLPMPTLNDNCPTICPVDAKGEIFGMTCLRKWGRCVRNANLNLYDEVSKKCMVVGYTMSYMPTKFSTISLHLLLIA